MCLEGKVFVIREKSSTFAENLRKMAKDKIAYVCSNCGQESAKWIGKCPSCGQWNTFKEIRIAADSGSQAAKNAGMTMRHGGAATMFGGQHSDSDAKPMKLRDISSIDEPRIDMMDEELNRVLGGGMVPGSITLLGGEPGIGKSTLTLQTILNMRHRRVLYVSGEESAHQIKLRADRLAKGQALMRASVAASDAGDASAAGDVSPEAAFDHITILCETQLEKIFTYSASGSRTDSYRLYPNHCYRGSGQFSRLYIAGEGMCGVALAIRQDQWHPCYPDRTY